MNKLPKPFQSVDEEIHILKSRGLTIANEEDAKAKLLRNNYYTVINGYKYPFLDKTMLSDEHYKNGASFDELFSLYEFDCQLRALLLKYILRAEHQLKSVISHVFAGKYRDIPYPAYLEEQYFDLTGNSKKKQDLYDNLKAHISAEMEHQMSNNNPMLVHYKEKYDNIPPWILVSVLSFGMIRIFYDCLKNQDQNAISRKFNLYPNEMSQYLSALNTYRNACAHDERIYNLKLRNKIVRRDSYGNKAEYRRLYVVILILKDMLDASTFMAFYADLDTCIHTLSNNLKTIPISDILYIMGIPEEPAVRKDELGPLQRGDAFLPQEFRGILERYILPILPVSSELLPVSNDDENHSNPRCALVECRGDRLYFAQSTIGNFAYYIFISIPSQEIIDSQIEIIKDHLSVLIDYTHAFWNFSNLSVYEHDKVKIAFPNLCEQAYELTICNLLCRGDHDEVEKLYRDAQMEYKRACGNASLDQLQNLKNEITQLRHRYQQIVKDETSAQQSIYGVLTQIESWASKTYEGQRKTFGIIFCKDEQPASSVSFNYIDFLRTDFSATINDGLYSAVELYADGSFKRHLTIPHTDDGTLSSIPYPFTGFANLCTSNKIGILLTNSGDIMIINDRKLCYTKHGGLWLRCNADIAIEQIKRELGMENFAAAHTIYQTIADISYSRGGACIGIVNEDDISCELRDMIEGGLLSTEPTDEKRVAIKSLIMRPEDHQPKSFYELDRHLRRELLELDGALVFSKSGLIHVIGTIIKLKDSGSSGGGRTAAAMQLSEFGLAIKISQDGYVQMFKNRNKFFESLI